jgi:hypothetical protein
MAMIQDTVKKIVKRAKLESRPNTQRNMRSISSRYLAQLTKIG